MAAVETPQHVRAEARYVRTAPRKAQLVVEQIRGRPVPEARTILAFMTRDAARDVERVLSSAVANAEANHGLVGDDLYVSKATAGDGPTLKRWRARARGRVARIKKRTCHIRIELSPATTALPSPPEEKPAPTRKREATPQAATVEAAEEKPKAPRKRTAKPKAEGAKAATAKAEKPKASKPKKTRKKTEES
jgi:ribosomal protein L22